MKIIKNKYVPFKGYKLINLFGIIFQRNDSKVSDIEYNHEKIHLKQMQEMLFIPFYLFYGIEYVIKRIIGITKLHSQIYYSISFEREAYTNQYDLDYCNNRKKYSWVKYLLNK